MLAWMPLRQYAQHFLHVTWLEDRQLLRDAHRLADIPGVMIHGRFDIQGPPDVPWLLHQAWPGSELHLVGTGHQGGDEMTEHMMTALNRFAWTQRFGGAGLLRRAGIADQGSQAVRAQRRAKCRTALAAARSCLPGPARRLGQHCDRIPRAGYRPGPARHRRDHPRTSTLARPGRRRTRARPWPLRRRTCTLRHDLRRPARPPATPSAAGAA
jgi:hypothetical protein